MWVKICGVTSIAQAADIAAMRPDALGLNFYARSPRSVSPEVAAKIREVVPSSIQLVGVFVNSSAAEIARIVRAVGLDAVQLHGDETVTDAVLLRDTIPEVPLVRAIRVGSEGLDALQSHLEEADTANLRYRDCLVDARHEGAYGGTGKTAPWDLLRIGYAPGWPGLILAGGLTPANVAQAITAVRPRGVDTASGVESSPGMKNLDLCEQFLQAARRT